MLSFYYLLYIVVIFQKWWWVSEWEEVYVKGQNNLPLFTDQVLLVPCFPVLLSALPPLFFFPFFQNSEVAVGDSPVILGLGELLIDTGEWQQFREENLAKCPFFYYVNSKLPYKPRVSNSVKFLFTPSPMGRFAEGRNRLHPGNGLGLWRLILLAPGLKNKNGECHSVYTSDSSCPLCLWPGVPVSLTGIWSLPVVSEGKATIVLRTAKEVLGGQASYSRDGYLLLHGMKEVTSQWTTDGFISYFT